jgi:hypothetical protein
VTGADATHRRPGRGALAMVVSEFDRLPLVDDRYRLWPWSRRALAQRRRCSPGTVHKHHQALLAPGVLVTDDQGRTLVDTVRLDEARHARQRPTSCRHREPTRRPNVEQLDDASAVTVGPDAEVLLAIEALTAAAEARRDVTSVLMPIIGRLAQLLEDASSARALPPSPARANASGARGGTTDQCGSDQVRCPSTVGAGARPSARDRAPFKKERTTQASLFDTARDSDLPGLSFSLVNEARADGGARRRRAPEGRAAARTAERLLELLGPLDPARHVTYLEGVQAALGGYDDSQVTHAIDRIVLLDKATINPVGLLVDRANAGDPLYFPPLAPDAGDPRIVVEPPAVLWPTEPTSAEATTEQRSEALPAFDPDPTLAAALAARAALDAAHQPVTRDQLATRQATLHGSGTGGCESSAGEERAA